MSSVSPVHWPCPSLSQQVPVFLPLPLVQSPFLRLVFTDAHFFLYYDPGVTLSLRSPAWICSSAAGHSFALSNFSYPNFRLWVFSNDHYICSPMPIKTKHLHLVMCLSEWSPGHPSSSPGFCQGRWRRGCLTADPCL